MRHKLNEGTERRLLELLRLIRETRPLLSAAGPSVCAEWDRIRGRFPSEHDAREGYTSLSDIELEEVRVKVQRFRPEVTRQDEPAVAQSVRGSSTAWPRATDAMAC
jgi:hypothetical protein